MYKHEFTGQSVQSQTAVYEQKEVTAARILGHHDTPEGLHTALYTVTDKTRRVLLLGVQQNHPTALSKHTGLTPNLGESASAGLRTEHKHMYFERTPQVILTHFPA